MNEPFAISAIETWPEFSRGSPNFGAKCTYSIPKNGDFVNNCYMTMTLPPIWPDRGKVVRNQRRREAILFFLGWCCASETSVLSHLNYDCVMHICNKLVPSRS